MPITKSYAISMLAVLNSRRALAERARDIQDLGTFGMTIPSITTANIAFDRQRLSFNHGLSTQETAFHDDTTLDLSELAHAEYSGANKTVDGKEVGMGPEVFSA
ncbi:hypothetical protein VTO73DRAFT_8799 [Trametes versicolor]